MLDSLGRRQRGKQRVDLRRQARNEVIAYIEDPAIARNVDIDVTVHHFDSVKTLPNVQMGHTIVTGPHFVGHDRVLKVGCHEPHGIPVFCDEPLRNSVRRVGRGVRQVTVTRQGCVSSGCVE